jgi:recombination protein RecA
VKVVKNKVAPPFRQADFEIIYGEGVSHEGELVDLGVHYDILSKSGSWYSYGSERVGQGKDNVKKLLKERPELAAEIEARVREKTLAAPKANAESAARHESVEESLL